MANNSTSISNHTAITEKCIGMFYLDAADYLKHKLNAYNSDSKISDSGDEDGVYVMCHSLILGDGLQIRLYYLYTEGIVEHVEITE